MVKEGWQTVKGWIHCANCLTAKSNIKRHITELTKMELVEAQIVKKTLPSSAIIKKDVAKLFISLLRDMIAVKTQLMHSDLTRMLLSV